MLSRSLSLAPGRLHSTGRCHCPPGHRIRLRMIVTRIPDDVFSIRIEHVSITWSYLPLPVEPSTIRERTLLPTMVYHYFEQSTIVFEILEENFHRTTAPFASKYIIYSKLEKWQDSYSVNSIRVALTQRFNYNFFLINLYHGIQFRHCRIIWKKIPKFRWTLFLSLQRDFAYTNEITKSLYHQYDETS